MLFSSLFFHCVTLFYPYNKQKFAICLTRVKVSSSNLVFLQNKAREKYTDRLTVLNHKASPYSLCIYYIRI